MYDLQFDIETRELVLTAPLGSESLDVVTTNNPSVQNGGILLYGRCINCVYPMFGVGIEDAINSTTSNAAYEMNRWQQMCKNDGGTLVKWTATQQGPNYEIVQEVSYL